MPAGATRPRPKKRRASSFDRQLTPPGYLASRLGVLFADWRVQSLNMHGVGDQTPSLWINRGARTPTVLEQYHESPREEVPEFWEGMLAWATQLRWGFVDDFRPGRYCRWSIRVSRTGYINVSAHHLNSVGKVNWAHRQSMSGRWRVQPRGKISRAKTSKKQRGAAGPA